MYCRSIATAPLVTHPHPTSHPSNTSSTRPWIIAALSPFAPLLLLSPHPPLQLLGPVEVVLCSSQSERLLFQKVTGHWGGEAAASAGGAGGAQVSAIHRRCVMSNTGPGLRLPQGQRLRLLQRHRRGQRLAGVSAASSYTRAGSEPWANISGRLRAVGLYLVGLAPASC
jgi:hypothetical protein